MTRRGLGAVWSDDFFIYGSAPFTFTVGTENFQATIPIQSDAHFVCMVTMYDSSAQDVGLGGTAVLNGGALIQITNGGTQRALSNVLVPINTWFGTAQRPFVWPQAQVFIANTSIGISITGAALAAQIIRLSFGGYKAPLGSLPDGR